MSSDLTFVVTGATGFIGRALCAELSRNGYQTYAISRHKEFMPNPGVMFQSVSDYSEMQVPNKRTICIHLAGNNNVREIETAGKEEAFKIELKLADCILSRQFEKVIFASSGLVYGFQSHVPHKEKDLINPSGVYSELKDVIEQKMLDANHIVARIANVYGNGMSGKNVISSVLRQLPGEGAIKIKSLTPVRDYIHVSDVVRGLVDLAIGNERGVFNLSTGVGTSVLELIQMILKINGQHERKIVQTDFVESYSCVILDSDKMFQCYGWKAQVKLRDGLSGLLANQCCMN